MSADPRDGGAAERYIPAFVIVFLFFAPQLAAVAVERNRYFLFWGGRDTLAACAAIAALALAGLAVGGLVNRTGSPSLRGLRDHLLAILFGLGLGVNLLPLLHFPWFFDLVRQHRSSVTLLSKVGLVALVVGWLALVAFRRDLLPRLVRTACVILSPLLPIMLLPSFAWTSWDVAPDPIPRRAAAPQSGTPVYLFVFDEWSYARSTEGDDFDSDLPQLRSLRKQSYFFTDARSPSRTTYLSMPELLFQSDDLPSLPRVLLDRSDFPDRVSAGEPEYRITPASPEGRVPASLFTLADRHGYPTYLLGYYLPYRLIFGDAVDLVRTYSDYPRGGCFRERMAQATMQNPHYWRMPVLSRLWKEAYAGVFSRHWVHLNERLWDDFDAVVDAAAEKSFVVVHLPSPHAPFVFEADGRYSGPFAVRSTMSEDIDVDIMSGTRADYHRSLRHLDTVVGRIVERLSRAGRFDPALVIMTSDHAWRCDPDMPQPPPADLVRHVPLLIKVPGQRRARTIDAPFDARSLGRVIEAALGGGLDTAAADRLIPTLFEPVSSAGGTIARGPARP